MKATLFILISTCFFYLPLAFGHDTEKTPLPGIQQQCFEYTDPLAWELCLYHSQSSKSQELVYYFHGRNQNAKDWYDTGDHGGKIHLALVKNAPQNSPWIAALSFGPLWLLLNETKDPQGGLQKVLMNKIIPEVDRRLGFVVKKRSLLGISMGGINALLTGFQQAQHFSRIVSLCPPLHRLDKDHPLISAWGTYWRSQSMSLYRAIQLYIFSRKFFSDAGVWEENDPFAHAQRLDPRNGPQLYYNCGLTDSWDCQQGAEKLAEIFKLTGFKWTLDLRPGGHCDVNYDQVAKFLLEP